MRLAYEEMTFIYQMNQKQEKHGGMKSELKYDHTQRPLVAMLFLVTVNLLLSGMNVVSFTS